MAEIDIRRTEIRLQRLQLNILTTSLLDLSYIANDIKKIITEHKQDICINDFLWITPRRLIMYKMDLFVSGGYSFSRSKDANDVYCFSIGLDGLLSMLEKIYLLDGYLETNYIFLYGKET